MSETRSEQTYIDFDPYADECDVRCRKVKIVAIRKPQQCFPPAGAGDMHECPPGTRMRFETAIVDGEWGRYYTCLACIDRYMDEEGECFFPIKQGANP